MPRWLRHVCATPLRLRRSFPPQALEAITAAVRACESRHAGEIRFAVEATLPLRELLRGTSPRQRACKVFSDLGVWDTEHNNGVLIYLLLADRDVEIVADRGVAGGRVPQSEWEQCCRVMEAHFREGRYREGAIAGIEAAAAVLAAHPPPGADVGNELPDRPALL